MVSTSGGISPPSRMEGSCAARGAARARRRGRQGRSGIMRGSIDFHADASASDPDGLPHILPGLLLLVGRLRLLLAFAPFGGFLLGALEAAFLIPEMIEVRGRLAEAVELLFGEDGAQGLLLGGIGEGHQHAALEVVA